jgi:hypothetical protein
MLVIPRPEGRGCKGCPPEVDIGICDMIYVGHAKKNSSCSLRSEISLGLDTEISQIPSVWFYRETC